MTTLRRCLEFPDRSQIRYAHTGHRVGAITESLHLRLATEAEIGRLFLESELGAMPPLGNLFDMPVYVDQALTQNPGFAFNAGTHRDAIHMSFADFRRAVEPKIATFSCRPVSVQ